MAPLAVGIDASDAGVADVGRRSESLWLTLSEFGIYIYINLFEIIHHLIYYLFLCVGK